MIKIEDITPGRSYGAKFRVTTMLDDFGRPAPNLSDVPLKGMGDYEGFGLLVKRDTEKRLVEITDLQSKKNFVVSFDDIWDIDEAEIRE